MSKKNHNIEIPIEYARDIHKVLENHTSMSFSIMDREIKEIISEEAYGKLTDIFKKYHNANCGPFNRYLRKMIERWEENNK